LGIVGVTDGIIADSGEGRIQGAQIGYVFVFNRDRQIWNQDIGLVVLECLDETSRRRVPTSLEDQLDDLSHGV